MKIEEIRTKTDSELEYDLAQLKKELFELRMKASMERLANPGRIRELRRSVARINTIVHERATSATDQESH